MVQDTRRDWHPSGDQELEFADRESTQKLDHENPTAFAQRMMSFCRTNRAAAKALLAGNIQLLGFEHVRDLFGANWGKVKDQVHQLAEMVIRKHITEQDVYLLVNDEQYVVLFGIDDRPTAEHKSRRIADEVNSRLADFADGTEGVTVRPLVLELPREEPARLETADALTKTVEDARREREGADRAAFDAAKTEMRLTYWPVANFRKRIVSMYQANVVAPPGTLPSVGSETGALEAALDSFTIGRAAVALVDAAARGDRAFLIIPVHFETLNVKRFREALIEQCRLLPHLAETRALLMVRGLPDDVPQSKLHAVLNYVAPFVGGFIGEFGIGFQRRDRLAGIALVGAATVATGFDDPDARCLEMLSRFVAKNRIAHTRCFLTDASTLDTAMAARRAGFDYVQGTGVAPAMAQFGAVFAIS